MPSAFKSFRFLVSRFQVSWAAPVSGFQVSLANVVSGLGTKANRHIFPSFKQKILPKPRGLIFLTTTFFYSNHIHKHLSLSEFLASYCLSEYQSSFLKANHNLRRLRTKGDELFIRISKFVFESKSQHLYGVVPDTGCCLSEYQSSFLKANHN